MFFKVKSWNKTIIKYFELRFTTLLAGFIIGNVSKKMFTSFTSHAGQMTDLPDSLSKGKPRQALTERDLQA